MYKVGDIVEVTELLGCDYDDGIRLGTEYEIKKIDFAGDVWVDTDEYTDVPLWPDQIKLVNTKEELMYTMTEIYFLKGKVIKHVSYPEVAFNTYKDTVYEYLTKGITNSEADKVDIRLEKGATIVSQFTKYATS